MKYESFNYSDKEIVEKLLKSDNLETRISAIIGMVNGICDREWVQDKLLENISDNNFWIAKNSIVGLSDLARIYRKLDIKKVKKHLSEVKNDSLGGVIKSVMEDFDIYLSNNK